MKDTASLRNTVLDRTREYGPFGAAGFGELPLTSSHPAVMNAMDDAPPSVSGIFLRFLRECGRA